MKMASIFLLCVVFGCGCNSALMAQCAPPATEQPMLSPPPHQPPPNTNTRAKKGALIGGLAGVTAGLISGNSATKRRQRALVGGAVGAGVGAGIGHYQDQQEAALRAQLHGSGVVVRREGDTIRLEMPSAITFAFNHADIHADFFPVLEKLACTLSAFDQTHINIVGHTDSVGSEVVNQRLSEQRAEAVAQFLQTRGVLEARMHASGRGKLQPIDSNSTEMGRANNRRVEISLVPIENTH